MNATLRRRYEYIFSPLNKESINEKMLELRKLVIDCGLPEESPEEKSAFSEVCSIRGKVWKVLLGVFTMDAKHYFEVVQVRLTCML